MVGRRVIGDKQVQVPIVVGVKCYDSERRSGGLVETGLDRNFGEVAMVVVEQMRGERSILAGRAVIDFAGRGLAALVRRELIVDVVEND